MAFGWFLRRFCRWGDRASQWKEGLRKGWVHSGNCTTCFGSAVRGMKVGDRLTPGGLGLQVDESVLIPVASGKPQNVSGEGSGLIKLERIYQSTGRG